MTRLSCASLLAALGTGLGFWVTACSSGSATVASTSLDAGDDVAVVPVDAGTDGSLPAVMGGSSSLALGVPTVIFSLPVARSVTVPVSRMGSSASPVTVTASGLPMGVTAMPLTIPAGASSGLLTLVADGTAVLNATSVPVTLSGTATSSGAKAKNMVQLVIVGTPGTLDGAWGTQGVSAGLGQGAGQITGVALQKSGAVVVGGFVGNQLGVARYTSAGVLDAAFGTAGVTLVSVPSTTARTSPSRQLAVDPTDRLFVGAQFSPGNQGEWACFTAAGVLDTTFGTNGFFSGITGYSGTVTTDGQGRVLFGGAYQGSTVYRVTSAGVSDTTFGQFMNGYTAIEPAGYDSRAVAVQSTGRIIAVGHNNGSAGFIGAIADDGNIDGTFAGGSGRIDGSNAHAWEAVAVGPVDVIFAAGQEAASPKTVVVTKVTKDGAPDPAFGSAGITTHVVGDASTDGKATAIAVQKDGKLVIAGSAMHGGRSVMVVLRLLPDGKLDTTFGADQTGIAYLAPGAAADANSVAIQADGHILVGGHADSDWAVARLWP
jgi:uncharacterized delta-60 repeat protein